MDWDQRDDLGPNRRSFGVPENWRRWPRPRWVHFAATFVLVASIVTPGVAAVVTGNLTASRWVGFGVILAGVCLLVVATFKTHRWHPLRPEARNRSAGRPEHDDLHGTLVPDSRFTRSWWMQPMGRQERWAYRPFHFSIVMVFVWLIFPMWPGIWFSGLFFGCWILSAATVLLLYMRQRKRAVDE